MDDSELVNSYDKQYEKVKKKAKAKLPPIDSMSELSFNEKVYKYKYLLIKELLRLKSKLLTPYSMPYGI